MIGANTFGASASGIVPASGGGTADFLRADGSWAVPPSPGGPVLYESMTAADGVVKTFAFSPALVTLTEALADGSAFRPGDVSLSGGSVVLGAGVAAPDTGTIITALGTT
jgi:hypothetical protein